MSVMQTLLKKFHENKNADLFVKIIKEIQTCENFWIAFSENSNGYLIRNLKGKAAAFLFSEKEYCDKYSAHLQSMGREVAFAENPVKYRMALFADLYRCGFNCIVIDDGQYNITIDLFDIIKEPTPQTDNKETRYIVNPALMRTANWIFQENSREDIDESLWQLLSAEVFKAEYIIPIDASKLKVDKFDGREISVTEDSRIAFPVLENKEGQKYYPFFTDWNEYRKYDMKNEYSIMAASFKDMKYFVDKADGVVINPFGVNILLNDEMLKTIAEASDHYEKEVSKLSVGNPKEYPLEMVKKISESLRDKKFIKAAYLKLMLNNREQSYLVALEGKLPDQPAELYNEIAENALPNTENIPIDFIDYSTDFAKKVFRDSKPFYSADTDK